MCANLKNTNNILTVIITGRNSTLYWQDAQGRVYHYQIHVNCKLHRLTAPQGIFFRLLYVHPKLY